MERAAINDRNQTARREMNLQIDEVIVHRDSPQIRRWKVCKLSTNTLQLVTIGAGEPSYFTHRYARLRDLIKEGSLIRLSTQKKTWTIEELTEEQIDELYRRMNAMTPEEAAQVTEELWPGKTNEELNDMEDSLEQVMGAEYTDQIILHLLNTGRYTLQEPGKICRQ